MSYKYKKLGHSDITKDGHTMLTDDVVSDLNKKSFVEDLLIEQNKEIANLKAQLEEKSVKYVELWHVNKEMEKELANSIPKERVEVMIADNKVFLGWCLDGDKIFKVKFQYADKILNSLLSNQPVNQGDNHAAD